MALIIEDGSIVPNANSFTTDAELQAYALARNITLPATEAERDSLQILAMDYLFSVEHKLKGCRVSIEQELPYPRVGVCANGFDVPSDTIPKAVKNAMMELAMQAHVSDLLINKTNKNVASEKVDVIEVSYFSGGSWESVNTGRANAYLTAYYIGGGNVNETVRV